MIRRLRRRHLWMVAVVAIVIGVILILALRARPDRAVERELPDLEEPARP